MIERKYYQTPEIVRNNTHTNHILITITIIYHLSKMSQFQASLNSKLIFEFFSVPCKLFIKSQVKSFECFYLKFFNGHDLTGYA
ncbi:hypothetical protein BpHYR1_003781 [Brachionus plicatilis]|uniref:Uncharacterized protein n=1 Tax=Brachionus plicatilis TaxID=10195 RepID=A0A3M7RT08_BRAPC|nr:hypothetical protein BpHYR1_003781 [Brachionus plicatilis]